MSLEPTLQRALQDVLTGTAPRRAASGPSNAKPSLRLTRDAQRLWHRVEWILSIQTPAATTDRPALELACYALQLPAARPATRSRKPARTSLRDRAERSAELLIDLFSGKADADLLERAARLLQELPQRHPTLDEARILADAVNLDDFGVTGLLLLALDLGREGQGLSDVLQAAEMRERYGYWDARLHEGFFLPQVRQLALARLEKFRQTARRLEQEIQEEQAKPS